MSFTRVFNALQLCESLSRFIYYMYQYNIFPTDEETSFNYYYLFLRIKTNNYNFDMQMRLCTCFHVNRKSLPFLFLYCR